MKISWPSASIALPFRVPTIEKIIMFLERKRFGSISFSPSFSLLYFFLSLYLPYTHSRTVILKNLMQIKQNTAPLPGFSLQRFLTALCNYASLKHTKFLLTVLEGMLFCSVSKQLCVRAILMLFHAPNKNVGGSLHVARTSFFLSNQQFVI